LVEIVYRRRRSRPSAEAPDVLILAAFDFAAYANAVQGLELGDRFLPYTDGLIEAADANGDFFGQEALAELLSANGGAYSGGGGGSDCGSGTAAGGFAG
jgi:hypothetical protein